MTERLTAAQHAAIAAWWARHETHAEARRELLPEFVAAGFMVGFSCITWRELVNTLPNMAEVVGRSIIIRHRLRA